MPTHLVFAPPEQSAHGSLAALAAAGLLEPQMPLEALARRARLFLPVGSPAMTWLRAQHLAMAALRFSRNLGLSEHLLPALQSGERAGAVAEPLGAQGLTGEDSGRGWRLSGRLDGLPPLPKDHFTLIAPVRLGHDPLTWIALRGEEDGLDLWPAERAVNLRGVFFREDEWLADQTLGDHLQAWADRWTAAGLSGS